MTSSVSQRTGVERDVQDTAERGARTFEPNLVLWSEELEKRRLAVARWRGLDSLACEQKSASASRGLRR
jgi:hypothetical protein